jgi:hypothetical protein
VQDADERAQLCAVRIRTIQYLLDGSDSYEICRRLPLHGRDSFERLTVRWAIEIPVVDTLYRLTRVESRAYEVYGNTPTLERN